MTQYFLDTFTGAADTDITTTTPDVGDAASWNTTGLIELDGVGNCRVDTSGSIIYAWNDTVHASENYEVRVRLVLGALTNSYICGAVARASDSNNMYIAWIKGGGGFQLKKKVETSGTGSDLVAEVTGIALSASAEYDLFLKTQGTTISARLVRVSDSVQLVNVSTTDSAHAGGAFGVISLHATSDIVEIEVNDIPAAVYTLDVGPIINNSGSLLTSQSVDFSWWPGGRAGEFAAISPEEGSETTDSNGEFTINVTTTAAGCGLAKVAVTDETDDLVFYFHGTPS